MSATVLVRCGGEVKDEVQNCIIEVIDDPALVSWIEKCEQKAGFKIPTADKAMIKEFAGRVFDIASLEPHETDEQNAKREDKILKFRADLLKLL